MLLEFFCWYDIWWGHKNTQLQRTLRRESIVYSAGSYFSDAFVRPTSKEEQPVVMILSAAEKGGRREIQRKQQAEIICCLRHLCVNWKMLAQDTVIVLLQTLMVLYGKIDGSLWTNFVVWWEYRKFWRSICIIQKSAHVSRWKTKSKPNDSFTGTLARTPRGRVCISIPSCHWERMMYYHHEPESKR